MRIHTKREKPHETFDMGTRICSPEAGVYSILKYELGYGGRVVEAEEDHLVIQTQVLAANDTVTVTLETTEESRLMFTALKYWYDASKEVNQDEALMDKFMKMTGGNAFLVTHGLPVIFGAAKVRRTLLLCMGLGDKPEIVERLQGLEEKDLVAIAELVREGSSWEEAIEVAQ